MSLWTHPDINGRPNPSRDTRGGRYTPHVLAAFAAVMAVFALFIAVRPFSAQPGPVNTPARIESDR